MTNLRKIFSFVIATAAVAGTVACMSHTATPVKASSASPQAPSAEPQVQPLKPPANGQINVAFIVSDSADVMDIVGPLEAFGDTMLTPDGKPVHDIDADNMVMPFHAYTVSDSKQPISAGGLKVVPDYTFATAPKPQVIVIPAQPGRTAAQKKWLLANAQEADITMSVCTGVGMLAGYGMLDGLTATTHHLFWGGLQKRYPAVHFVSGTRFVDHGKIATAGGVTSGIDLALHVIDRYYGQDVAAATASFMEYRSQLWKSPEYDQVKPVTAAQ